MRTREYTKGIAFSGTTSGTFPPRENGEARSPSQPQKKRSARKKIGRSEGRGLFS